MTIINYTKNVAVEVHYLLLNYLKMTIAYKLKVIRLFEQSQDGNISTELVWELVDMYREENREGLVQDYVIKYEHEPSERQLDVYATEKFLEDDFTQATIEGFIEDIERMQKQVLRDTVTQDMGYTIY